MKALRIIIVYAFLLLMVRMSVVWYNNRPRTHEYLKDEPMSKNHSPITYVPSEGFITSEKMAIDIAKVYVEHHCGRDIVKEQTPFTAYLSDDVWTVVGNNDPAWYKMMALDGYPTRTRVELDRETGAVIRFVPKE